MTLQHQRNNINMIQSSRFFRLCGRFRERYLVLHKRVQLTNLLLTLSLKSKHEHVSILSGLEKHLFSLIP